MPASQIDGQFDTPEWPLGEADVARLDARCSPQELLLHALLQIEADAARLQAPHIA